MNMKGVLRFDEWIHTSAIIVEFQPRSLLAMPGTGMLFPSEYLYEWHGHTVVILPDTADTKLILKVRPHTRKVLHPSIPGHCNSS
jgi:hypothetical protein